MPSPAALIRGLVSRVLPQLSPDGTDSEKAFRLGRDGSVFTTFAHSTKHPQAHEGAYFAIGNPTEGTGVAGGITSAFTNTVAAFAIFNNNDANNPVSRSIDIDFLKLLYTVAPATASAMRYAIAIDDIARTPSAGFAKLTGSAGVSAANPVGQVINLSGAIAYAFTGGVLMTVPAPGPAVRYVARGGIAGLPVVGTEHLIRFGADGANSAQGTIDAPVSIAPGKWCVVHIWWPGNATTGPSAEYSLGLIEK